MNNMVKNTNEHTNRARQSIEPAKRQSKATGKAPASGAPAHREVTFAVYEPAAGQVYVSGAFNGWSREANPLTRQANRDWKATIALPPGRHEYKFVVDGKWKIDPRAHHVSPNGLGTLNSVLEVQA